MTVHPALKYFRDDSPGVPHLWCAGCGIGQVWYATTIAIEELALDTDEVVWVGGSGCTGRMCTYWHKDVLHTLHGRALAYATGVKIAKPELTVLVHSGDGECMAIGGNHLIQAARRNVDLTVIAVNNFNYGMTGGQFSPTTPRDALTTTSPYGNLENPFRLSELITACGGTYVARWTTGHPLQVVKAIKRAILNKGFSFVEVVAQCPTQWGKMSGMGSPAKMIESFRQRSVPVEKAKGMTPEELEGAIVVGELTSQTRPEFVASLHALTAERSSEAAP
jgi:2-oxoglutarate/2-oxoacid ferredoxin oxidoreductase subunit beta